MDYKHWSLKLVQVVYFIVILDFITTYIGLFVIRGYEELHPLLKYMLISPGNLWLLFIMLSLIIWSEYIILKRTKMERDVAMFFFGGMVIAGLLRFAIVVNNIKELIQ